MTVDTSTLNIWALPYGNPLYHAGIAYFDINKPVLNKVPTTHNYHHASIDEKPSMS